MTNLVIRTATIADAAALHSLIASHQAEGHLLPRSLDEIRGHAGQFVVAESDGTLAACAELAPLSAKVAEVRSLVVSEDYRRAGLAGRLVTELSARAKARGFDRLCAFTHAPGYFIQMGFSIVPHLWLTEKIFTDCVKCPLFRRCGQYAMVLPLHEVVRHVRAASPFHRVAVA